jgi:7,8-dihydropterin-6-yl-methyl-4-(beta-D-ribofuranosyl)aminobenzene 5'-phosphate synthase
MPSRFLALAALIAALLLMGPTVSMTALEQPSPSDRVSKLTITILSTMLADEGFGEWGFAALVDVNGRRILFDTGANDDTVARNVKDAGTPG